MNYINCMILKLEQNASQNDIEVLITYPAKTKVVERIVSLIKSVDTQIECYSDDIVKLVNVSDIYYIESVDGKTVVCCEKEKYIVKPNDTDKIVPIRNGKIHGLYFFINFFLYRTSNQYFNILLRRILLDP